MVLMNQEPDQLKYRWFHKIVAKANHYCIRCHRLILPWTFCYAESNYIKHLCCECHVEIFGEKKIVML
jgi:hypothetical protein